MDKRGISTFKIPPATPPRTADKAEAIPPNRNLRQEELKKTIGEPFDFEHVEHIGWRECILELLQQDVNWENFYGKVMFLEEHRKLQKDAKRSSEENLVEFVEKKDKTNSRVPASASPKRPISMHTTAMNTRDDEATKNRTSLPEVVDKSEESSGNSKKRYRKLKKEDIGFPQNFRHISHVGWDNTRGFDVDFSQFQDPNMKKFFEKAGVSASQLENPAIREFISAFIEREGGLAAINSEINEDNLKSSADAEDSSSSDESHSSASANNNNNESLSKSASLWSAAQNQLIEELQKVRPPSDTQDKKDSNPTNFLTQNKEEPDSMTAPSENLDAVKDKVLEVPSENANLRREVVLDQVIEELQTLRASLATLKVEETLENKPPSSSKSTEKVSLVPAESHQAPQKNACLRRDTRRDEIFKELKMIRASLAPSSSAREIVEGPTRSSLLPSNAKKFQILRKAPPVPNPTRTTIHEMPVPLPRKLTKDS